MKAAHYKTIVISDTHLGSKGSKAKELVRFLKMHTCDKLILNGDIIDAWQLKRTGKWKKKHTRFFKLILKMSEKANTEVIYLRGNHDDFLDNVVPLEVGRLKILNEYFHESHGNKYWILHGDIFDNITTNLKWLAKLGDIGYTFLLWLNKVYNNRRVKKGLPYYSLSQTIKQKVKSAVSYISDYEKTLVDLARTKDCQGVICGHIHHAAITNFDGVMYLNSGDWVETLSALLEDENGNWSLAYYTDFVKAENEEKEKLRKKHSQKQHT